MNFLDELARSARECSNLEYRATMNQTRDRLARCINAFNELPSRDNMEVLNGAWAFAARVLKAMPPEQPPAPLSGAPDTPLLQRAA